MLRSFNPGLTAAKSQDMATHVLLMASYYGLDPRLLVAIVGVESGWQSDAVSHAGARGLGQLMPETAGSLGVLAADPYENLDGTARYLRRMIAQYAADGTERRYQLALASYNAGPQSVAHYGGIPPFVETRNYVTHVMALWHELQTRLPENSEALALIARTATRATTTARRVAARMSATLPVRTGSVAQFAALDARSVQEYLAYAVAAPAPTREPRTFKRWFARAFGIAKR